MTGINLYVLLLLLGLGLLLCNDELISPCSGAPDLPSSSTSSTAACKETERMALVEFKKHIIDPNNRLSSWDVDQDCCSWEGVSCDNTTGNVVRIDLQNRVPPLPYYFAGATILASNNCLRGEISPSLLRLRHLNHLDFSGNYFYGSSIPSFMGQFKELRYLDLSYAGFVGSIPPSLGNLSSLQTLYLTYNDIDPYYNESSDYQWLSNLTSLQNINMDGVPLGNSSTSVFLALNKLPSIKEIYLHGCEIEAIPLNISSSSLSILDLSQNSINFSVSGWMFNLKSLEYLDLGDNLYSPYRSIVPTTGILESIGGLCNLKTLHLYVWNISKSLSELGGVFSGCLKNSLTDLEIASAYLKGEIPDWIGDIKNLKSLDLSVNSLSGSLPSSLGKLSLLEELVLYSNELNGTLPEEIGKLKELVNLNVNNNQMSGVISEAHFAQLEKLDTLDLSFNSQLVFNVSSDWVPPFLLKELRIGHCSVGSKFPTWLRTQHKLNVLDMSFVGISDTAPDWFWNTTAHNLVDIDLSHNQIEGMIPKSVTFINTARIDLSSNRFYGPIPEFPGSVISYIYLFNNSFSGPIPSMMVENVYMIILTMNKLNGSLPASLCQVKGLQTLDVSKNELSGEIPDCWSNSTRLWHIDLSHNNFTGGIPNSICVNVLRLGHNKLYGEFPATMKDCSTLHILDLGYNGFTGSIPIWVGVSLSNLAILNLKSNTFVGHIPQEISQLKSLQILDLSNNNFLGPIPKSLGNLTAMQTPRLDKIWFLEKGDTLSVRFKGIEDEYPGNLLPLMNVIDLSNNNLSGSIPEELAGLYGLLGLDLSGNHLEGDIPKTLGGLRQLLSLDLSRNELSGSIPSTLSNMTFLSLFNVSYNNLSGRIPTGNQFNTFQDPSIDIGNNLCGFPLSNCGEDGGPSKKGPHDEEHEKDEDDDDMLWLYIGSVSGFAVGFWSVWGILAFKKKWRHAYFRCADNIFDNIYVYVVVRFRRMKNKIMTNH